MISLSSLTISCWALYLSAIVLVMVAMVKLANIKKGRDAYTSNMTMTVLLFLGCLFPFSIFSGLSIHNMHSADTMFFGNISGLITLVLAIINIWSMSWIKTANS